MVDLVINNISKQKTYMITVIVIFVSLVLYYSSIDVYNLKLLSMLSVLGHGLRQVDKMYHV